MLDSPGEALSTDELLILAVQPGAPAVAPQTFYVSNARATTRVFAHQDGALNLYLELDFPRGSIAQVDGAAVGAQDSVQITVSPASGDYGITIGPSSLVFASGARPAVSFSFARYGDLSVADGSPTYASRADYADALALWRETSVELWRAVAGSGPTGDEVSGTLESGGAYVVAAPR